MVEYKLQKYIPVVLDKRGSLINPSPADPDIPAFANSVDPDQLASEEAN